MGRLLLGRFVGRRVGRRVGLLVGRRVGFFLVGVLLAGVRPGVLCSSGFAGPTGREVARSAVKPRNTGVKSTGAKAGASFERQSFAAVQELPPQNCRPWLTSSRPRAVLGSRRRRGLSCLYRTGLGCLLRGWLDCLLGYWLGCRLRNWLSCRLGGGHWHWRRGFGGSRSGRTGRLRRRLRGGGWRRSGGGRRCRECRGGRGGWRRRWSQIRRALICDRLTSRGEAVRLPRCRHPGLLQGCSGEGGTV